MTIKGRIGNTAIVEDVSGNVNINQDVALLRFKENGPPIWYVLAYLNSSFGKLQIEKFSTGAINPFLGLYNIKKLKIPIFNGATMVQIGDHTRGHVISARKFHRQASELLHQSKRAVEIAIEEGESAAFELLDQIEEGAVRNGT